MPGPAFLRGETVTLNPVEEEDVPFLLELINEPRVWRTLFASDPKNARQEREWVESLGEDDGIDLLTCVDGDPVGVIGLNRVRERWGAAEVGYMVAPEHRGEGYATAAVDLLSTYAFEERRLEKLGAEVLATNPASARVLEKAGYEREGVLRGEAFAGGERVDVHRYGRLADRVERD